MYLKSVNAQHVDSETLGAESMADRSALVDHDDARLLELSNVLAGYSQRRKKKCRSSC